MASQRTLKICYLGGGSRFVVTLLHGLAQVAARLATLTDRVELVLVDPATERTREMAAYAEIVRACTGLPLHVQVNERWAGVLADSSLVLYSVGHHGEVVRRRRAMGPPVDGAHEESVAGMASEAAVAWPTVATVASCIQREAPQALFATLVNPTDVLAAAVQRRYGVRSIGLCVEVPQLVSWLAMHLGVPRHAIDLDHLGLNHCGWVGRWTVDGRDGSERLARRLQQRMAGPEWDPVCDDFASLFRHTGYLRTSAFHSWPFHQVRDEAWQQRRQWYRSQRLYAPLNWDQFCQANLGQAMAQGRMIGEEEDEEGRIHRWAMPYKYCSTRHTLGALAVGLAGGRSEAAPLQAVNGRANPVLDEDVWGEVPTVVDDGRLEPQRATPLPGWMGEQLRLLGRQRSDLAQWLSENEPEALTRAICRWPDTVDTTALEATVQQLHSLAQEPVAV